MTPTEAFDLVVEHVLLSMPRRAEALAVLRQAVDLRTCTEHNRVKEYCFYCRSKKEIELEASRTALEAEVAMLRKGNFTEELVPRSKLRVLEEQVRATRDVLLNLALTLAPADQEKG